jgi:DGQHR domain-containing protein
MRILGSVQKDHSALALIDPIGMDQLFFVSTYSEVDPDSPAPKNHGYQRDPMAERFPGIAKYYGGGGPITPLVVSVRVSPEEIADFERFFNKGEVRRIHERWHKAVASIIDGQHRFKGLVKAHNDNPDFHPMAPVLLLYGLGYVEEATTFDVINTTQRKLPKALIEVTAGDITHRDERSHAQDVREIAFALARDKDSVWFDKVNMTGARDPEKPVTYEGLRRSSSNMFSALLIKRLEATNLDPKKVAKDYWRLVSGACQAAWEEHPTFQHDSDMGTDEEVPVAYRLKDLVGVASLSKLGNDIVTSALEAPNFDDRIVDLVSKLSEVDWRKDSRNPWMASQAGFAGQKELYELLYDLVYMDRRPGEDANH